MADVFIEHGFVDSADCARLRAAIEEGRAEAAEILEAGVRVDEAVRRAEVIDIDPRMLATVEARFDEIRDRIAARFGITLVSREGTGFLRYRTGGRYLPHRDRGEVEGWPGASQRQVALVLFLNSSRASDPAAAFAGGALTLYGPGDQHLEIAPREGTLVAFPADILHEVQPVTAGVRDVAIDWFY